MAVVVTTAPRPYVGAPRWGFVVLAVAALLLWLVAFEGGSLSELTGRSNLFLHEMFHDGRHLLGVPCH